MPKFPIDRDYLYTTLVDLIRINSINPSLSPQGKGEAEIAAYVARSLQGCGLLVDIHEPQMGRVSVVGRLPGRGGGRNLMLNAHSDTVGIDGMDEPFAATVREGRLYGRGAQDMKASLAACMAAAKALAEGGANLRGEVLVAAVADEEFASLGTADLIGRYALDGAVVTEPSDLQICLAHKGFVWLEIETFGRPAHGSRFMDGIDAIRHMGRVLAALEALEQELFQRLPHPLVGNPSLHASKIEGGTEWSIYPDHCRLQVERRTVPGESASQVEEEVQAILDRLAAADPAFRASLHTSLVRQPHEVAPQAGIVQALAAATRAVLQAEPVYTGHTAWMDSALLSAAGVESVVMGPVGGGLHTHEEWVDLDSVAALAEILVETACNYCGEA